MPRIADNGWNVVRGCTKVSAGCRRCYVAEELGDAFHTVTLRTDLLDAPRAAAPSAFFVSDDGDLFHPDVPDSFVDEVVKVMRETPQHTYLVCTKRPERLFREWPKNAWVGVSAEDQLAFDMRAGCLEALGGVRRFLSAQPLLGPIDLRGATWLSSVCAGGEYGPGAEGAHQKWVDDLRAQCATLRIPFTYQQNTVGGQLVMFPEGR